MEVNGPGSIQNPYPIDSSRPPAQPPETKASQPATPRDQVEISSAAQKLDEVNQSSPVRAARVAQIKAAIEAGEYETDEKLEAALDKLLGEIRADERSDT